VIAAPAQAETQLVLPTSLAAHPSSASSFAFQFNSAADSSSVRPTEGKRSAARSLTIHGVVGTATGLLLGLVLSSASLSGDETAVVLTWTAVGAAAGVLSGIVTWLLERRE
jgi:uncharacterized YccA/Bax inhibitor family protein